MSKILVVEDSPEVARVLEGVLAPSNTVIAPTLAAASKAIDEHTFDLILLDLHLPDGDGLKFFATLKLDARVASLPVIFLTSCQDTWDKVTAFTLGAQDYVTKPFDSLELRARVQARLSAAQESEAAFSREDLRFDLSAQQVWLRNTDGEGRLDLTPLEFKLLVYFARNENHVLARNQLIDAVWGSEVHVLDRTVDSHVSGLRAKIQGSRLKIDSVYGEGYILGHAREVKKKSAK